MIRGSKSFRDRTIADLGVMLGTTQGSGLLNDLAAELEADGSSYTFREKVEGPGGSHNRGDRRISVGNWAATYSAEGANRHPLPALFHEIVHAYQYEVGYAAGSTVLDNGTRIRNIELQATGLPYMDAAGDLHEADEFAYTDNLFRAELGMPIREGYGGRVSPPASFDPSESDDEHEHV